MRLFTALLVVAAFSAKGSVANEQEYSESKLPALDVIVQQDSAQVLNTKDLSFMNTREASWKQHSFISLPRNDSCKWDMLADVVIDSSCKSFLQATLAQWAVIDSDTGDPVLVTKMRVGLNILNLKMQPGYTDNFAPIMCASSALSRCITGQQNWHTYTVVIYDGDVVITTGRPDDRDISHLTGFSAATTATHLSKPSVDERVTKDQRRWLREATTSRHLNVDFGTVAQHHMHTYEVVISNLNPEGVQIAFPVLAAPGIRRNPIDNVCLTALPTTTDMTVRADGEHYLVTAAKAKAVYQALQIAALNSTTVNTTVVLHVPESFDLPLYSDTHAVIQLLDSEDFSRKPVVLREVRKADDTRDSNVMIGKSVVGYSKAFIPAGHTLVLMVTLQNLQLLSDSYRVDKNVQALHRFSYTPFNIYTPHECVQMAVIHSTVASGIATHNGKALPVAVTGRVTPTGDTAGKLLDAPVTQTVVLASRTRYTTKMIACS
jgi:hypothetical protein